MRPFSRHRGAASTSRQPLPWALVGVAAAFGLHVTAARAEEGYSSSQYTNRPAALLIGWEYAFPANQLKASFIDVGSPAGVQGEFRTTLLTQLSAGIAVTWNQFGQTYASGEEASYWAVSVRGTVHWYFTRSTIQPYVGVGVGGVYEEAVFGNGPTQAVFGFCADPQVGLLLTLDQGFAVNVLARYEFTTASFDVNGSPGWPVTRPQWIGIQVGLAFY